MKGKKSRDNKDLAVLDSPNQKTKKTTANTLLSDNSLFDLSKSSNRGTKKSEFDDVAGKGPLVPEPQPIEEMNNIEEIMNQMINYVESVASRLDLRKQSDRDELDRIIIKHCMDCNINPVYGSDIIYETFNSIARERNKMGDIEASLQFLMLALEHIKDWQYQVERFQGEMKITILSELYINICNAQYFLEKYDDVQKSASQAIEISDQAIEILELQIKDQKKQPQELERIENNLYSQRQLNVHANITIAQAFEQNQKMPEAIKQYKVAKQAVKKHFSEEHQIYEQMEQKIEALSKQVKEKRGKNGSESMNVLIVSAKDEQEELDVGASFKGEKLEDLENRDHANRSIIGGTIEDDGETVIKGRGGRVLKKKAKKARGVSKDVSASSASLKYQIRENKKMNKRNGSSAQKSSSQAQPQRPKSAAINKYYNNGQSIDTYQVNKRRNLGVGIYDYQPSRTNLKGGYYIDQFGYKRYAPRNVKMAPMEYDLVKFANERNSHQLQDSCRHMGTHHNFSHYIQSLGISPVVGGPRSWYYSLSRPNLIRPTHRSLVSLKHMRPRTSKRYREDTSSQSSSALNEVVIKQSPTKPTQSPSTAQSSFKQLEQMRELREKLEENERNAQIEVRNKISKLKQDNDEQEQEILRRLEEQQRQMIEDHRRAMEEENKMTLELMFQLTQMQQQQQEEEEVVEEQQEEEEEPEPHSCEDWRCHLCNPPPQTDEDYGPPVFDPYFKCWTFPYAQPKKKEKKIVIKKKEKPQTHNMEVQVEYQPEPSPEKKSVKLQTFAEMKTATYDDAEAQTNKVNTRAMQTLAEAKAPPRYTDDQAANMIMRLFRRIVMGKRLLVYRTLRGILYSRKYMINKISGSLNIMSMHMICNYTDETCTYLSLSIFDYVTRKFLYFGKYEHLDHVKQFNGYALLKLAEPSLKLIDFEDSPFTEHIACLQSVININREHDMISLSMPSESSVESSSSTSYEPIEPQTPEPIYKYIEPEVKEQKTISTQVGVIRRPTPPPSPPPELKEISTPRIPTPREETPRIPTPEPEYKPLHPPLWYMYYVALRMKLLLHIRWMNEKKQQLLYRSNKHLPCCNQVRHFKVELWKVFKPKEDEEGYNFYYKLTAREYQSSFRRAKKKVGKNEPIRTSYHQVRLPGDREGDFQKQLLKCYLDHAIVLKLDQKTCEVYELKLMRMKVHLSYAPVRFKQSDMALVPHIPFPEHTEIGCNLKLKFMLTNKLLCKVYRRVRWEDPVKRNRKYKDWKVKVLIDARQEVYDYLVVHKLPCKLSQLEKVLKQTLHVAMNEKVIPNVIQYVVWKQAFRGQRKTVDVKSQTYYDFMGFDIEKRNYDDRYNYDLDCQYYLTQSAIISRQKEVQEGKIHPSIMCRMPQIDYRQFKKDPSDQLNGYEYCPEPEVAKQHDPFYEILVQLCVPKDDTHDKCVMYQQEEATNYSLRKNKNRIELLTDISIYSSEESDPEVSETGHNEWAWDERQLRKIQMDEHTKLRRYRKITCQLTTNKQDQDWFVYDHNIGIWAGQKFAGSDTVYQYLLAEMRIFQDDDESQKIQAIMLKISDLGNHYLTDDSYENHLKENQLVEHFMAQDTQRWLNQDFSQTVYSLRGTEFIVGGDRAGGYLVEAVHIWRPAERAYRHYEDLAAMRDGMLTSYIDEQLQLYAEVKKKKKNQQVGKTDVIKSVKFEMAPAEFKEKKKQQELLGLDEVESSDDDEKERLLKYHYEMFKKKILPVWKAWHIGQKYRRQLNKLKRREYEIINQFLLMGDLQSIYVFIKKYKDKQKEYQFILFNQNNQTRRDDLQFINRDKLPPDLTDESPREQFQQVFQERLRITWNVSRRIRKIESYELDYKVKQVVDVVPEETISVSEPPVSIVPEEEPAQEEQVEEEIPEDVKADLEMLKAFLQKLRSAVLSLENGLEHWWVKFDEDKSDMIEFDEFLKMLEDLEIFEMQRNVYLMFHLFDSLDVGCFTKIQFEDLIYEFKKPDYVQVILNFNVVYQAKIDRLRNPKKPEVIKTQKIVEVPEQVVQKKIIYKDKIVYEDVMVQQQIPQQVGVQPVQQQQLQPAIVPSSVNAIGMPQVLQNPGAVVLQQPVQPVQVQQQPIAVQQPVLLQQQPVLIQQPQPAVVHQSQPMVSQQPVAVLQPAVIQQPVMSQPQPVINVLEARPILQQEQVPEIQQIEEQPAGPQNFEFQPYQLDQEQAKAQEPPPLKVQQFALRISLQDLFLPLQTVLKTQRKKVDQVFKKYDSNSSQQLSVSEAKALFKDVLNVDLDAAEQNWLLSTFKKDFKASEIRKQTFVKLVEAKAVRKFNIDRAEEAYEKLTRGLSSAAFEQLFKNNSELVYQNTQVCLRSFKVILKSTEYLIQSEIDSLTAYLHKHENGFIQINDFYSMKSAAYDPDKTSRSTISEKKPSSASDEAIMTFYDIFKPFQHLFLSNKDNSKDLPLAVENLFKKFNRGRAGQRNLLMSVDEFKDMIQYYCKYRLEESEVKVIREHFENFFQRKEIKRTEMQKLIEQKWARRYNEENAKEMFYKLRRPLGQVLQMKQLFFGAVEENQMINIRNFKKCIEKLRSLKRGDKLVFGEFFRNQQGDLRAFSSFTQYLEYSDNGYIDLNVFDLIDQGRYAPEEVKAQAVVAELFTYSTFRDIMLEIKEKAQNNGMGADEIFTQYDVDRSFLLSYKEISQLCSDLKIELDKAEIQLIDTGLKKMYGRADIKKAELANILNDKYTRRFDEEKARKTFKKFFPNIEDQTMIKQIVEQCSVELQGSKEKMVQPIRARQFKKLMNNNFNCQKAIDVISMDHMTQFLERPDTLIDVQDLRKVLLGQYKPPELNISVQPKAETIGGQTTISDILLPLRTELAQQRMQPTDLFDAFDKDKNFLLSAEELVNVIQKFTNYRPTQTEQELLLKTIKKVSGTTGMRTELKREEISKLFDMVEMPRLATEAQAKSALSDLKKLYMNKQLVISQDRIEKKEKITVCEFKHMLTIAGMKDQDHIDLLYRFFQDAKLPGYIMADRLHDELSKRPDLSMLALDPKQTVANADLLKKGK